MTCSGWRTILLVRSVSNINLHNYSFWCKLLVCRHTHQTKNSRPQCNVSPTHLCIHLLGLSKANLQSPRLVVGTVWTWYQFTKGTRSWEPCFQIQLLCSSIVQFTYETLKPVVIVYSPTSIELLTVLLKNRKCLFMSYFNWASMESKSWMDNYVPALNEYSCSYVLTHP